MVGGRSCGSAPSGGEVAIELPQVGRTHLDVLVRESTVHCLASAGAEFLEERGLLASSVKQSCGSWYSFKTRMVMISFGQSKECVCASSCGQGQNVRRLSVTDNTGFMIWCDNSKTASTSRTSRAARGSEESGLYVAGLLGRHHVGGWGDSRGMQALYRKHTGA